MKILVIIIEHIIFLHIDGIFVTFYTNLMFTQITYKNANWSFSNTIFNISQHLEFFEIKMK